MQTFCISICLLVPLSYVAVGMAQADPCGSSYDSVFATSTDTRLESWVTRPNMIAKLKSIFKHGDDFRYNGSVTVGNKPLDPNSAGSSYVNHYDYHGQSAFNFQIEYTPNVLTQGIFSLIQFSTSSAIKFPLYDDPGVVIRSFQETEDFLALEIALPPKILEYIGSPPESHLRRLVIFFDEDGYPKSARISETKGKVFFLLPERWSSYTVMFTGNGSSSVEMLEFGKVVAGGPVQGAFGRHELGWTASQSDWLGK